MKKYDIYCALLLLFGSIFVSGISLTFGMGTLRYPGPGLFPFLIGLLLSVVSVLMIIMVYSEKHKGRNLNEMPSFAKNVPYTLVVLFAYAASLEFLGYIIGTLFLLLYLFKVMGSRKWWVSILMTFIVVSLTYFFFGVLLKSQLPKGIFK